MKYFLILLFFLSVATNALAQPDYSKALKKWARSEKVYVWDNFEARAIWHAIYLSPEFRAARQQEMIKIFGADSIPYHNQLQRDREEAGSDVFLVFIYSGSSKWPEIGKDTANWRFLLHTNGTSAVDSKSFERLPITEVDRSLYPFLDKWSHAYQLTFPKSIQPGQAFHLRMAGVPAKSELVWNTSK